MRSLITTAIVIFGGMTICFAQHNDKPNALSLELGKSGLIFNLTYDHKFKAKNLGFRFGVGSDFAKYTDAYSVGGGSYYLVGKKNNFLELGLDLQYLFVDIVSNDQGFALIFPDYSIKTIYPSINIGYRSYAKRTLFRIGFSPGIIDKNFLPGGYISFGSRF